MSEQPDRLFERFGRSFADGESVFAEGVAATEVFMVVEGRIRLLKRVRRSERDIAVLKAGDVCGEAALIRGQRHPCSAVALGDSKALALKADEFEALLRSEAELSIKLVYQLVRRLQAAEERIESMMLRDKESKIVNALLKLAEATAPQNGRILLSVSPIELASRIGIDVDSVKRGIFRLKDLKHLAIAEEKLEIVNLEALQELYNQLGVKDDLHHG